MSTPGATLPLISVNDHLIEPADLWSARCSARLRDALPHVAADRWMIGSTSLTIPELSVVCADGVTRPARSYTDMLPAVWSAPERLVAMDADGVAVHTLLPHVIGFAGERLVALGDARLWLEACRIYNSYLTTEFCAEDPQRLVAIALLPFGDIDAAVAEAQRAAHLGARGVSLPHDAPVADKAWEVLFDALAALDLPIFVHVGSAGGPPSVVGQRDPAALLLHGGLDVCRSAIDLLCSGVLARHPSLRVVMLEGGAGWLPYLAERVEFFTRKRPEVISATFARVLREQLYVSYIDDRQATGGPHELWQSDFPHADSTWPDSAKQAGVERARAASQVTAELLKLKMD